MNVHKVDGLLSDGVVLVTVDDKDLGTVFQIILL